MQQDLDRYHNWCYSNRLTINSKKTKFMCFGLNFKWKNCKFKIGRDEIFGVSNYKYLGVIIDQALNYEKFMLQQLPSKHNYVFQTYIYVFFSSNLRNSAT